MLTEYDACPVSTVARCKSAGDARADGAPDAGAPLPPEVLRGSLRYSIKDAMAWSVMQGGGIAYLVPFIVLGGHGLLYQAAFSGLPALAWAFVQWGTANLTDALGQRNRVIVSGSVLQALAWLPVCVAIFLPAGAGFWLMLAAYVALIALANFPNPAWQSLMGDLVPEDRRGRYFGVRNALANGTLTAATFGAGWWLTLCQRYPSVALFGLDGRSFGFLALFALAGGARLLSAYYLSRVCEPPYRPRPADRFTFLQFLQRAPKAHFGRFVFWCALLWVGIGSVLPYLAWYLLEELKFSPGQFATATTAGLLTNVLSQPLWGRLNDRFGSKRVLAAGGVGLVASPLLLLGCTEFWHFVLALAYDGLAMAAYNIAIGNYLFDAVTPPKRARCAAYQALFVALGTALGNLGGALLAQFGPTPFELGAGAITHPFSWVLLGSAAVRCAANFLLLGSFAEFRLTRPRFG